MQGEADVLEVCRRGARDVRADIVVVVRLPADGRDVDDADPGGQRPAASTAAALAARPGARRTATSPPRSTPRRRRRQSAWRALRATGVSRGYHADVALEALGRRVQALIAVRTSVVYEHIRRPVLEPLGSDTRT